MKSFRFLKGEFRYFFGNLKRAIPILAILFIPILYSGVYLYAFWDPYGHLNRMPVAVVNLDQGAQLNGKPFTVGNELVQKLKENQDLQWNFVSEADAKDKLEKNQVYMMVEIPQDFSSETVASLTQTSALQPKLEVITNDRYNYIAAQISRNAADKLHYQTAQNITETYLQNLLTGIVNMANGYDDAAAGASQVATGASDLTAKSEDLKSGANRLSMGVRQAASGTATAVTGSEGIVSGSESLKSGAQTLTNGLNQLAGGSQHLSDGAAHSLSGIEQLNQGIQSSSTSLNQTVAGLSHLADGLKQYAAAHPELAKDPNFQALEAASQQLKLGTQQLAQAQAGLVTGAAQLQQGQTQFTTSFSTFTTRLQQAEQGSNQLTENLNQLVLGSRQLNSGLSNLSSGLSQTSAGASQLQTGISQYTDGTAKLASGANELAHRLQTASEHGPHDLNPAHAASAAADPVGLTEQKSGHVDNYGTGFAPYFLSLGLFVGALLMSIVIDFRKPAVKPESPFAWFFGKTVLLVIVGAAQALIADCILIKGIGLEVSNTTHFVGFSLLTSLAFIAILQFLVTTMDNPGRFVAVILLILQLTSSSGTYPSLLSPVFFQKIAAWLPMTYSVSGFRYLTAGGDPQILAVDWKHLLAYVVSFMLLTLLYYRVRFNLEQRKQKAQPVSASL